MAGKMVGGMSGLGLARLQRGWQDENYEGASRVHGELTFQKLAIEMVRLFVYVSHRFPLLSVFLSVCPSA